MIKKNTTLRRAKIKAHIRKKIFGTPERPRLSVYRSLTEIYGQIIDDVNGVTLVAVSSIGKTDKDAVAGAKTKTDKSVMLGKLLAKKAAEKNISTVVFDRNGLLYHGRVKAFADSVREGGLKF
jgi:large subunit ribosomal protein L18